MVTLGELRNLLLADCRRALVHRAAGSSHQFGQLFLNGIGLGPGSAGAQVSQMRLLASEVLNEFPLLAGGGELRRQRIHLRSMPALPATHCPSPASDLLKQQREQGRLECGFAGFIGAADNV